MTSDNLRLWESVVLALLSGMAGCVLTLLIGLIGKWWQRRREFGLLKQGLFIDLTTAIDEIKAVVPTYTELYQQNEFRVDDSMLLGAKERLVRDFCDAQLLKRVSKALSSVRSLNRLLDHYRDECLECTGAGKDHTGSAAYIAQLNVAVKASFRQAITAMADLGSYAEPKEYAARIERLEKSRVLNKVILKELSKEFENV